MSVEGKFLSKEINDLFWREGLTLVTAESCTAGSVAAAITAVAGSSHFFKGGIIAYSNEIKENLLGVNHGTLETHGAVAVSVLSLIYDKEKRVQLLIDKGLMNVTYIGCHPCTNTCSLKIKMEDILTVWLPATGHDDMKVIE